MSLDIIWRSMELVQRNGVKCRNGRRDAMCLEG